MDMAGVCVCVCVEMEGGSGDTWFNAGQHSSKSVTHGET